MSGDELEVDEAADEAETGAVLTLLCEILWLTGAAVGFAGAGAAAITIAVGADATGAAAKDGRGVREPILDEGREVFHDRLGVHDLPIYAPADIVHIASVHDHGIPAIGSLNLVCEQTIPTDR